MLFRSDALVELEHALQISEEVIRHLVTRDERPAKPGRREDGSDDEDVDDDDLPSLLDGDDVDDEDAPERIDESETEAAPAAID